MSQMIIEARALHTYYGASHILRGVDFSIHAGETVGLMGRNGMGKTTLIKTLLGLVPARQGELLLRGKLMLKLAPHVIAQQGIAYVPEGRGIFPNLTVRENLLMAARPGIDGRREWTYQRILEIFPSLRQRLTHAGDQLSGGEQQMLTIGRALLTNPDLLILDEATEGLAPMIAKDIWRIIEQIRSTGMAAIIVDKNYRILTAIADRSVILVKGAVAYQGSSQQLRERGGVLQKYLGV